MKRILLCAALLVVFAPGLLGQEAEFKRDLARAKEIAAQFAPKDEFETTAAYEARLRQAEAFRPALDAIQAKEYILDVDITVGTYNADRQTFPVTASRKDYLEPVSSTLSVPLSIARTMKSRLKSAKGRFRIWRGMPQVRALWVEVGGKALAIPVEWVPGPVLRYEEDRRVTALAFNADGSLLASGGGGDSRLEEKSHVNLWDMRTFTRIAMLEHPDKARFPWWIPMVAFNADSTVLAATFWDERAVVRWDLPSLSVLPVLQHANRVNGVGFNEDDNEIVVVDEGLIFVWDALKNELKRQYRHHPSAIGGRSRIAPDGKHVLLIKSD
ncbi:hypothetical protein FJZ36_18695, partial [Candidatus Poribacteria bacterium]|nr:hypothetical protein [Candidatus Poribacteria bacterium]